MITSMNIRTEYLTNPIGLDILRPQITWEVKGASRQIGGELEVKINGVQQAGLFCFEGSSMRYCFELHLHSRDRVEYRLRLQDEQRIWGEFSDWNFFEIGLLEKSDWKATWIMGDYPHLVKPDVRYPVDYFCKTFSLSECQTGRLYISACGMYEAWLNGKRVGNRVLTPGSTAFQKRVHYQVYDVSKLLQQQNQLVLLLADGFYASKTGCFDKAKVFGHEPKILAQLEAVSFDGSRTVIATDASFAWSNDGPIRYADLKDGETVDSNLAPSFSGRAQQTSYNGFVCADNNVPVAEKEVFCNPKIIHCPDGNTVLDFGQNIAGYISFQIKGIKGHTARLVCGEKLDDDGNFSVKNISLKGEYSQYRFQTTEFICSGERQTYQPRFTVMGFQYALLLDWPEEIRAENFTAIAVYSDMPITGVFDSSDEGLNQIVKNTIWSMKGNFLDVPTDCPTRERAGWTGDAQLFFNTGNYLMDQAAFFRKWMQDVADCQRKDGMIYNINPANPKGDALIEWFSVEGGVGWGDAFIMIPYFYWKRYGDDRLIRTHWSAMKKCFTFYARRLGKRNIFSLFNPPRDKHSKYLSACGRDFGEWTEPEDCAPSKMSLMYPHPEEGTAYISFDANLMSQMSAHMELYSEAEMYSQLAERTKQAYRHYFIKDGAIESQRMAKYVRPCALNLVNKEERQILLGKIKQLNRDREFRVGTGFLSTPFVLQMITEAGVPDEAYKMLTNPEFGWMQQVNSGATTVWENWTNDASLNHYSKGACCGWLIDCLCGIKLDEQENHFVISPHTVNQLEHISFSYHSVYGTVTSAWKKEKEGHKFTIEIPSNCTAKIFLPDQKPKQIEAGEHVFYL